MTTTFFNEFFNQHLVLICAVKNISVLVLTYKVKQFRVGFFTVDPNFASPKIFLYTLKCFISHVEHVDQVVNRIRDIWDSNLMLSEEGPHIIGFAQIELLSFMQEQYLVELFDNIQRGLFCCHNHYLPCFTDFF